MNKRLSVNIMGEEIVISCPETEMTELKACVDEIKTYLTAHQHKSPREKIAVAILCALNQIQQRRTHEQKNQSVNLQTPEIHTLNQKIKKTLEKLTPIEV